MNVIEDTCLKINKVLSDNRDRDEIVTELAVGRLCNLFNSQTATFDNVLDELLKSIIYLCFFLTITKNKSILFVYLHQNI